MAQFELTALEGRGCRQRSPSRLDCTLNASGEAAFGVQGRVQDDFSLQGYLPICVSPRRIGPPKPPTQVAVLPHVGSSRVALAVVELDTEATAPVMAEGTSCESVLTCSEPQPRARFQVGVVSRDIPADAITTGDFRPVSRDVSVSAELRALSSPTGGEAVFLSTDSSCNAAGGATSAGSDEGGAPGDDRSVGLPLHIGAGQSDTEVFYLCAPGYSFEGEVTASALVGGGTDTPAVIPRQVSPPALTKGYGADQIGGLWVLCAEECGGRRTQATPGSVKIVPPLSVSADGQRVLLDCGNTSGGAAGAAGAGGARATDASTVDCSAIPLEVGAQGTCTLKVGE